MSRILGGSLFAFAAVLVVLVSYPPTQHRAFLVLLVVGVLVFVVSKPELVLLTVAVYISFVDPKSIPPEFQFTQANVTALLAISLVWVLLRSRIDGDRLWVALAPAVPLVVISIRMAAAGNAKFQNAALAGLIAFGAAAMSPRQRRSALRLIPYLAVAFVLLSTFAGPVGLGRAAGISGNPNRMVFALLSFTPFIVWMYGRFRIPAMVVFLPLASVLVVRSGSAQAIPSILAGGLLMLAMYRSGDSTTGRRQTYRSAFRLLVVLAIVAAAVNAVLALREKFVESFATLSGRTTFFALSWGEFLSSPFVGTGSSRVALDEVAGGRSSHNALLAVLAIGGFVAVVSLVPAGLLLVRNSGPMFRAVDPVLPALIIVATISLVQSTEFVPWTWYLVALGCTFRRSPRAAKSVGSEFPTETAGSGRG